MKWTGRSLSRSSRWALAATFLLCGIVFWRGHAPDAVVSPSQPGARSASTRSNPAPAPVPRAVARAAAEEAMAVVDLFPAQSWLPPPPPPPPPGTLPPLPKDPPALPFSVGALWVDRGGDVYIVLNASGQEFPLCSRCDKAGFYRKGAVLLGSYRIDALDTEAVRFTYLPLKRTQRLPLRG